MRLSVRSTVLGEAPVEKPKDRCTYCEKREECRSLCSEALAYSYKGYYSKKAFERENEFPGEPETFDDDEYDYNELLDMIVTDGYDFQAVTPKDYLKGSPDLIGDLDPDVYSGILKEWITKKRDFEVNLKGRKLKREHEETIRRNHKRAVVTLIPLIWKALRGKNGKLKVGQFRAFYQRYIIGKAPRDIVLKKGQRNSATLVTGAIWESEQNISVLLERAKRRIIKSIAKHGTLTQKKILCRMVHELMNQKEYGVYTEALRQSEYYYVDQRYTDPKDLKDRILARVKESRPTVPILRKNDPFLWERAYEDGEVIDRGAWGRDLKVYQEIIIPPFLKEVKALSVSKELAHLRLISKFNRGVGASDRCLWPDPLGCRPVEREIPKYDLGHRDGLLTCNYPLPPHLRYLSSGGNWFSMGRISVPPYCRWFPPREDGSPGIIPEPGDLKGITEHHDIRVVPHKLNIEPSHLAVKSRSYETTRGHRPQWDLDQPVEPWHLAAVA